MSPQFREGARLNLGMDLAGLWIIRGEAGAGLLDAALEFGREGPAAQATRLPGQERVAVSNWAIPPLQHSLVTSTKPAAAMIPRRSSSGGR